MSRLNLWLSIMGLMLVVFLSGGSIFLSLAPVWQTYTTTQSLADDDAITTPITSTLSFRLEPFNPRLIDAERERIYTIGYVDGSDKAQTLVLSLADERLLTSYDLAGGLALDTKHDRLYIDQYHNAGLAVLNTRTGQFERTITLPGEDLLWFPFPQADPATGHVLAFRDNLVYVADPENGTIIDTITFEVKDYVQAIAPVERPLFDPAIRLLYLSFTIHGCISSISGDCSARKVVVYDLAAKHEVTCDDSRLGTMVGNTMFCASYGWVPVWGESRPWFDPVSGGEHDGRVDFDATRQLYYEVTPTQLKVYDAARLTLTLALPRPISGTFERFEAKTDALQFRVNGQLQNWPAADIRPPAPVPLAISSVPTTPVQFLAVSPGWPADPTLLGVWLDPGSSGDYNRLFSCNSLFYISRDAGQTWGQAQGGLAGSCGLHWPTLAVSPDFVRDQTLFAGVSDMGILKSSDGGQLWRPSGVSLPDRYTPKILLSPGFANDKTVWAMGTYYSYRSINGGQTWQILKVPSSAQPGHWQDLALSAEFEQDHTILGSVYDTQTERARLFISKDGGDQWAEVGELPEGVTSLSLAPLFTTWQVVFAYGPYNLYRSMDGGQHWESVLTTQDGWIKQLVYAPAIEQNRPVFVLSALTDQTMSRSVESNRLYRSNDGGQTWQIFDLPAGVIPTALAISPRFAQDRTLFIGTAEGRVLILVVTE